MDLVDRVFFGVRVVIALGFYLGGLLAFIAFLSSIVAFQVFGAAGFLVVCMICCWIGSALVTYQPVH